MTRWTDQDEADGCLPSERDALRELDRIYRAADALYARASCPASGDCCQLAVTRREPYLFAIELRRLELALDKAGREMPAPRPDGGCPLLDATGRRCSVYPDRPFGCRTFFCDRGRGPMPKNSDVHALSARLTELADSLEPVAKPRQIRELLEWRRHEVAEKSGG
jgi:Fe-S-cluster containining protein